MTEDKKAPRPVLQFAPDRESELREMIPDLIAELENSGLSCELHVDHNTDAILLTPKKGLKELPQKTVSKDLPRDKALSKIGSYIAGWCRVDWAQVE